MEWFSKSEQGHADAQHDLGDCYCFSQGINQDYPKAMEWYTKAAEQGDEDDQNKLDKLTTN